MAISTLSPVTRPITGFSYYRSVLHQAGGEFRVDTGGTVGQDNPYLEKTARGWPIDAKGFRIVCNELADRYRKPLFVVENGYGGVDEPDENGVINDTARIDYGRQHIREMGEAIADGCDIMGYTGGDRLILSAPGPAR